MKKYCFGVDVGGTTIKMGLFTVEGELLEKWEIPTRTENQSEAVLPDVAAAVKGKMEEKGIAKEEVAGVGFGVPGPVTEEGVIVMNANLGWRDKHVSKELEELTGLPCKGGNDVKTAGLGEMWRGGAAGYKDAVFITLGTGVGAAIIVNGKVILGARGAAGEVGHIKVDGEITQPCGCGGVGCVEQFASATGIVKMAKRLLEERDKPSLLREKEITAKTVFDAVKAGDELAKEVAEKFGHYLGYALAATAAVVDPEAFIIGGGVSRAGDILIEYVQKYYVQYVWPGCRDRKFVLAKLGNDAGIYGAAKYVI
ncbi:MAG: ROK family glucokinase [Lachnospiraceae bacterium]|nr:ROK family glucokinase [Lachnospiraceae bacterium]MDD7027686.1 ROK family glucokinase [Lachnospiraceae bacterium]MDY5700351.1 ROK family glucokinase [Lachnospiraceae bacterium]